jgi:hypothetical protein
LGNWNGGYIIGIIGIIGIWLLLSPEPGIGGIMGRPLMDIANGLLSPIKRGFGS